MQDASVEQFIAKARKDRQALGISMRGRPFLAEADRDAIRAAVVARSSGSPETPEDIQVGLLERFEEMCRRQGKLVTEEQRPRILQQLTEEFQANQQWLSSHSAKVVAVTSYCGAIGPALKAEFPEFAGVRHVYREAMLGSPSDPAGFLTRLRDSIRALAANEEFADFRNAPGVFMRAAIAKPADPEGFMRQAIKTIAALAKDPEFAMFAKNRAVLIRAAICYPSDPKGFLQRVAGSAAVLGNSGEFAASSTVLAQAAAYHLADPGRYLRRGVDRDDHAGHAGKVRGAPTKDGGPQR